MADEEFLELKAQLYVQQLILVELCRRNFGSDDIDRFLRPLDPAAAADWAARGEEKTFEAIQNALAALRFEIMLPVVDESGNGD